MLSSTFLWTHSGLFRATETQYVPASAARGRRNKKKETTHENNHFKYDGKQPQARQTTASSKIAKTRTRGEANQGVTFTTCGRIHKTKGLLARLFYFELEGNAVELVAADGSTE